MGLYNWYQPTRRKTLGTVSGRMYPKVNPLEEVLKETQPLKINNPPDVNVPLDGILLTVKPLANGKVNLTAAVISGYSVVTPDSKRLVTTDQTSLSRTTKQVMSTVFVTPVIIVGTPSTILTIIGVPRFTQRIRLALKLLRNRL